jgi:hypothetical protein
MRGVADVYDEHDADAKVTWMRRVRASEADFSLDGQLVHVRLEPSLPTDESSDLPQQRLSHAQRERQATEARQRVAQAASGGLVRRLGADHQ